MESIASCHCWGNGIYKLFVPPIEGEKPNILERNGEYQGITGDRPPRASSQPIENAQNHVEYLWKNAIAALSPPSSNAKGRAFLGTRPLLRRRVAEPLCLVASGPRRSDRPAVAAGRCRLAEPSEAGEIIRRIDGRLALAQFEMQLRRGDVAGLAGLGDHLAALDRVAALDVEFAVVGVGGDEAVGVADQHEIAVALERAAGIGDLAVFRRAHRGALGQRDVDAVVAAGLEALDDAAARRPAELAVLGALPSPLGAAAATSPVGVMSVSGLPLAVGFGRLRSWRLPALSALA